MDEEMTGTPTLSDEDISTQMGSATPTAMERRPGEDADGTDTSGADGTDGDGTDGTDGDAADGTDGDATDGTDGDSGDSDGTDTTTQ
jgi:hypothetical protein